ncbi:hypothetical protein CKS_1859 [Pantoea stewartii subsp. stewartii DC283]|uniref:Uncharacterized protein n=1 Tax=Pantoea stewartii subsp. stewartii DC283 TaxID=660596 RepID=H3RFJ0_PANSE|nr:hypothetical protein CKS_1859 [Pantoea stewartii subsp. stewartii DC283]
MQTKQNDYLLFNKARRNLPQMTSLRIELLVGKSKDGKIIRHKKQWF